MKALDLLAAAVEGEHGYYLVYRCWRLKRWRKKQARRRALLEREALREAAVKLVHHRALAQLAKAQEEEKLYRRLVDRIDKPVIEARPYEYANALRSGEELHAAWAKGQRNIPVATGSSRFAEAANNRRVSRDLHEMMMQQNQRPDVGLPYVRCTDCRKVSKSYLLHWKGSVDTTGWIIDERNALAYKPCARHR